jgi:polar amino acid transport system substrate-binding protein
LGATIAIAAALLASCSSGSSNSNKSTTTPTTAAAASAPEKPCNPTAVQSIAPSGALPAPNQLPPNSFMKAIQDRGYLNAGVSADTLQFGFRDPQTTQFQGFDIDMVHQVAQAIFGDPNKVKFVPMNYAGRIPALKNGTVDIVADVMTMNCSRWNDIDFSSQYYEAGQKVMVPFDSKAKSINDLNGKTVCVAATSTNETELKTRYPKVIRKTVDDVSDCMVLFQQGLVDAVTGDDTVLAGFHKQDPYSKIIGDKFTSEPYGLGISKSHPDFVQFVNGVLQNMRTDGTWQALYSKWVGGSANPPTAQYGRPAQP